MNRIRISKSVTELIPAATDKAEQEGLPVLSSSEIAFEVVGRLYQLGIPG